MFILIKHLYCLHNWCCCSWRHLKLGTHKVLSVGMFLSIKHVPHIRKESHWGGNGDTIAPGVTGFPVLSRCMKGRNRATYRWERDVRSLKEPSGTLEMSLPWRVLKQKHRAGQPSESAVNSLPSLGIPGWLVTPLSPQSPCRQWEGPPPVSHEHGCFHTQLRSSNAVGRGFGKDQDALDVGWNQKSVPFSCGTLGELFSFLGPPFLHLKNGERESDLKKTLGFQR